VLVIIFYKKFSSYLIIFLELLNLKVFERYMIIANELMEFYNSKKSKRETIHLSMTFGATKFDGLTSPAFGSTL
jgi:hypothetical protein